MHWETLNDVIHFNYIYTAETGNKSNETLKVTDNNDIELSNINDASEKYILRCGA